MQEQQQQKSLAASPHADLGLSWAGMRTAFNVIDPEELTLGALIGEGGFGKACPTAKHVAPFPVVKAHVLDWEGLAFMTNLQIMYKELS
jgi:hypothetical protein